jgi:hypothetical protein
VDYRTKTFSCSVCGSEAYFCLVEPTKEFGMHDYRLDEREQPERHPDAVKRLTVRRGARYRARAVNCPAASSMDGASPMGGKAAVYGVSLELPAELGARPVSLASRLTVQV